MPKPHPSVERRLLDAVIHQDTALEAFCHRAGLAFRTRTVLFDLLVHGSDEEVLTRLAWVSRQPHLIQPTLETLRAVTVALLDQHGPAVQDAWMGLLPHRLMAPKASPTPVSTAERNRYASQVILALAEAQDPMVWVRARHRLAGSPLLQDAQPLLALIQHRPDRLDVPRLQQWLAEPRSGVTLPDLRGALDLALDVHFSCVDRLDRATWMTQAQWLLQHGANPALPIRPDVHALVPERFRTEASKTVHLRALALMAHPTPLALARVGRVRPRA